MLVIEDAIPLNIIPPNTEIVSYVAPGDIEVMSYVASGDIEVLEYFVVNIILSLY